MLEKELIKIGLSEKEAKVYLATLELGKSSVQQIANKSKVNRATTYVVLEGLQNKGVIDTIEEGKKKYFIAKGPYALKNIIREQQEAIEEKKKKLEKVFGKLNKVHNILPNRAVVKFYDGKEALQSIREQFLETKSKELHSFYSLDEVKNVFSKEDREKYGERRKKQKLCIKSIYNPGDDGAVRPQREDCSERMAVPKNKYHFPCDVSVYDDFVSIAILSGYPSGVVIESKAVADTMRSIFKLAYRGSEKFQKDFYKTEK